MVKKQEMCGQLDSCQNFGKWWYDTFFFCKRWPKGILRSPCFQISPKYSISHFFFVFFTSQNSFLSVFLFFWTFLLFFCLFASFCLCLLCKWLHTTTFLFFVNVVDKKNNHSFFWHWYLRFLYVQNVSRVSNNNFFCERVIFFPSPPKILGPYMYTKEKVRFPSILFCFSTKLFTLRLVSY